MALTGDGSVVEWDVGDFRRTHITQGLSNVVAVTTGYDFTSVLISDGTVKGWGRLGSIPFYVPSGLSNVVAIAAGNSYCLALKGDGGVIGWGDTAFSGVARAANVPAGLTGVVAISANSLHSLALKSDGTVVSWGYTIEGDGWQTYVPPNVINVIAIASGADHSLALKSDGTVLAWGRNSEGQTTIPEGLSNVVAVSAGGYSSIALKSDGTVVGWGTIGQNRPYVSPNFEGVVAIAGADSSLLALGGYPLAARPAITLLSTPRVGIGGAAVFEASTSGTPPLQYQWRFNGNDIPGANGLSLVITNAQFTDRGTYSLVVTNSVGSTTSGDAFLEVDQILAVIPTFWVSNTLDSGPGSLRQAILDANLLAGDSVIGFRSLGMFKLHSPLPEILRNTSIVGPGTNLVSISGVNLYRVFAFGTQTTNCLSQITVLNACVTNQPGAGVYNAGSLRVTNCSIVGNTAAGDGGGVFSSGSLKMERCIVAGNEAASGAGVNNSGSLSLVDCLLFENRSLGGRGGGIYSSGSFTILNCSVSNNLALGSNGDAPGTRGANAMGGGIYSVPGNTLISNSVFTDNAAVGGSGLGSSGIGMTATAGGTGQGGALFIEGGLLTVANTSFSRNVATGGQGGGAAFGSAGKEGGNAAGGGIFFSKGMLIVTNATLTANRSVAGEGGYGHTSGGNGGAANGAGISLSAGSLLIAGSTMNENVALGGTGGGSGSLFFPMPGFNGDARGGGTYFETNTSVSMINCTLSANKATGGGRGSGGGIWTDSMSFDLINSTIASNVVVGGSNYGTSTGGGIYISRNAVDILNTLVAENLGTTNGVTIMSDVYGTVSSQGHNLIGVTNGASGFGATDLLNVAPELGPLQNNGSSTLTHALFPGSLAIDAGASVGAPGVDQRGFPRPAGAAVDIGAYESGSAYALAHFHDDKIQVLFLAEPNRALPIQATTNFLNWQTIGMFPSTPTGQFLFEEPANHPIRFYRLVTVP